MLKNDNSLNLFKYFGMINQKECRIYLLITKLHPGDEYVEVPIICNEDEEEIFSERGQNEKCKYT